MEEIDAEARAQRIFEAQLYLNDLMRIERVGYAVLQAASPYCLQSRKYSLGVPPISVGDLPEDLRKGFIELQGSNYSDLPRFLHVVSGSPLRDAGVDVGEQLLSMTDTATGTVVAPGWVFRRPASTLAQNVPFRLELIKGSTKRGLEVRSQLICDERPRLSRQDELVARVSAGNMDVSTGLLRFVRNDDELALLLSKELAHSILSSGTAPQRQLRSGAIARYSPEEERAADYLGAYLTALSGFDTERAKDVWRRIAGNLPSKVSGGMANIHPYTAERALWQRATLAEIRRKNLTGQQLLPDRKSLPSNLDLTIAATDDLRPPPEPEGSGEVDPRLNRIADIPFIGNGGRSGYQRFLDTPIRPRAFAISPGAGVWAFRTGVNAAADALQACTRPFAPCYLYAIDDRVVWNPETVARIPQPTANNEAAVRLTRVSDVPFLNDEGRASYERFLHLTVRPRAFAIGPNNGSAAAWAFRSGPNASADALAYCGILTQGRPCYLYAVDDEVVWSLGNAPMLPPTPKEASTGTGALRRPAASGFADVGDLAAVPLPQPQLPTYRAFLEKPAPRAFVITQEGFGRYWLGTAAMEDALTYCERLGEPCWLYAVDGDVVWQADKTRRISRRAQLPKQSDELPYLK